jgi:alpha-ribazole phosphatase
MAPAMWRLTGRIPGRLPVHWRWCCLRVCPWYTTDARLVELNFGCWEGVPWGAIPASQFEAWTADFWAHRFGGQESVQALMQRVAQVWDESHSAEGSAVWITHAGVIRAATLIAQGVRQVSQAAHWPQAAPGFGQWCELAKEGGSWF